MAKRDLNEEAMKTNLDVEVEDKLQGVVPPTYVQAVKDHKESTERKEEVEDERKKATDKALDNKEKIKRNDGSKQMHLEESLFEDFDDEDDEDEERGKDDDLYELIDVELFGGANYKKNGSKLGLDTDVYPDRDSVVINSTGREKLKLTDTQDAIGVRGRGETSEAREAYLKRVRDIVDKLKTLYGDRVQYRVLGDNKYGVIIYDADTATDDSYETRLKMDSLTEPEMKKLKNKVKRFDWKSIEDEDDFRYAVKYASRHGDRYKLEPEEVEYIFAHKEKFYPRTALDEGKKALKEGIKETILTNNIRKDYLDKFDSIGLSYEISEDVGEVDGHRGIEIKVENIYGDNLSSLITWDDGETWDYVNRVEYDTLENALEDIMSTYSKNESKKSSKDKKPMKMKKELKESYYEGSRVVDDLVERAKGWLDDEDSIDDAVTHAIDDGLIYTEDIINLGDYYGVIDTGELIDRFYDNLYSDIYKKLEEDADDDVDESCKRHKKGKKSLKEGGYYSGESFCEEISSQLEDGNEFGYVQTPHDEIRWDVTINGLTSESFKSDDLFEYLLKDISYPVKDGYLNYIGLDEFVSKDALKYADLDDAADDLKSIFDVDETELRKFLKNKDYEIEFFINYDVDFDVEEYEKQMSEDEEPDLPSEVDTDIGHLDIEGNEGDEEVEEAINDFLSDTYGYLVNDYSYIVTKRNDDGDIVEIHISNIDWDIDESCKTKNGRKSLKEEEDEFIADDDFEMSFEEMEESLDKAGEYKGEEPCEECNVVEADDDFNAYDDEF